jgi:thioredoxin 1
LRSPHEHRHPVTDATFRAEVIESGLPVVVDIWATWCGPCRAIAPILDQLAVEYAGRVKIEGRRRPEPRDRGRGRVTSIPTSGSTGTGNAWTC